MRSSRADERSGRESVFTRPAHLDDVVARINAGESFADDDDEDMGGRYDARSRKVDRSGRSSSERSPGRDRRADRYADSKRSSMGGAMLEELEREVTVMRTQNSFLEKQLAGCMQELELHKRHGREFKTLLEVAELDLAASYENYSHASDKLRQAQEASRRNSEMAQQLLTHLNSCRAELKGKTLQNERLRESLDELKAMLHDARSGVAREHGLDLKERMRESAEPSPPAGSGLFKLSAMALPGEGMVITRAPHAKVTHEVAVQVDLLDAGRDRPKFGRKGSVMDLSMRHKLEVEALQGRDPNKLPNMDLVMERRPSDETRPDAQRQLSADGMMIEGPLSSLSAQAPIDGDTTCKSSFASLRRMTPESPVRGTDSASERSTVTWSFDDPRLSQEVVRPSGGLPKVNEVPEEPGTSSAPKGAGARRRTVLSVPESSATLGGVAPPPFANAPAADSEVREVALSAGDWSETNLPDPASTSDKQALLTDPNQGPMESIAGAIEKMFHSFGNGPPRQ
ncbi:hypothetical protein AB1Y20_009960 [Prymnesium parvum]|uniref:Uncharacterized protein n=1 Tax=Prymnesium parvum TaxID=97485 RepID=A0AB34K5I4_PRYPA|mmetsp:Transcript_31992/g.79670  ORF Transcript_31992/g.79670 Transcript_31992/m.79670 type:complete len:513 (-) Transcript_31992:321-1859(-)